MAGFVSSKKHSKRKSKTKKRTINPGNAEGTGQAPTNQITRRSKSSSKTRKSKSSSKKAAEAENRLRNRTNIKLRSRSLPSNFKQNVVKSAPLLTKCSFHLNTDSTKKWLIGHFDIALDRTMKGGNPNYLIEVCDNNPPSEIYNYIIENMKRGELQTYLDGHKHGDMISGIISHWHKDYYDQMNTKLSHLKGRYLVKQKVIRDVNGLKISTGDIIVEIIYATESFFSDLKKQERTKLQHQIKEGNLTHLKSDPYAHATTHLNYDPPNFKKNKKGTQHVQCEIDYQNAEKNKDCILGIEWRLCAQYTCIESDFDINKVNFSFEYNIIPSNCNETEETYIFFKYFIQTLSEYIKMRYDQDSDLRSDSKLFLINRISDICHDLKIDHLKGRRGIRDNIGKKQHNTYTRYDRHNVPTYNHPKYADDNEWELKQKKYLGAIEGYKDEIKNSDDKDSTERNISYENENKKRELKSQRKERKINNRKSTSTVKIQVNELDVAEVYPNPNIVYLKNNSIMLKDGLHHATSNEDAEYRQYLDKNEKETKNVNKLLTPPQSPSQKYSYSHTLSPESKKNELKFNNGSETKGKKKKTNGTLKKKCTILNI